MRINVSLDINPTIHLAPWKRAANQRAAMLFTEYEPHGLLFEIAEDPVWQTIPDNQLAGGLFRPRPTFDPPAPLAAGDGPAVRDAFKLATKARMAYLCAKATLTSDLLDSIGDINRESISDPLHGTSLLSPLAIRNEKPAGNTKS